MAQHPEVFQIQINPKTQTAKNLHELLDQILGRGGCLGCGRLAVFNVAFLPEKAIDPALAALGVVGLQEIGTIGR